MADTRVLTEQAVAFEKQALQTDEQLAKGVQARRANDGKSPKTGEVAAIAAEERTRLLDESAKAYAVIAAENAGGGPRSDEQDEQNARIRNAGDRAADDAAEKVRQQNRVKAGLPRYG